MLYINDITSLHPLVNENLLLPMSVYNFLVGTAAAYHGYKRNNDSIAWGLGWLLLPNLIEMPFIYVNKTIPLNLTISTFPLVIALFQGFGVPLNESVKA